MEGISTMYIVKRLDTWFSLNVKDNTIFPCFHIIRLSYNIYKYFSALSIRMHIHKTVNMVVFYVISNENTYTEGRALMQMYRVVPITKRGNCEYTSCCKKRVGNIIRKLIHNKNTCFK